MKEGLTGVSVKTPENIALGAGTIHIGLTYEEGTGWNFKDTCIGATKGGNSFEYVPELYDVEPDGLGIKITGLTEIVGSTASLTVNGLEVLKADLIKAALIGKEDTSEDATMTKFVPKSHIEENDYFKNLAFVGKTLKGEKIIIIIDTALCTSGFKLEGQSKEANAIEYVFEAYGDIAGDLESLGVRIYRPKVTA